MPRARAVVKKTPSDDFAMYAVVAFFLCLAGGFGGTWYYVQKDRQPDMAPAYVDTGSMLVALNGYVVSTRLAVETDKRDVGWASQSKHELVKVIENTLAVTSPKSILAPQGLRALQSSLTDACIAVFGADKIRKVLLTEFLIKENEY